MVKLSILNCQFSIISYLCQIFHKYPELILMDFVMILQLLIVLGALYVGSRYGSLALGAISGIGLVSTIVGLIITTIFY